MTFVEKNYTTITTNGEMSFEVGKLYLITDQFGFNCTGKFIGVEEYHGNIVELLSFQEGNEIPITITTDLAHLYSFTKL